jgi:hypothetical protein
LISPSRRFLAIAPAVVDRVRSGGSFTAMRNLVPHAIIVLALLVLAGGRVGEGPFWLLFLGGHLLAPIWAAAIAPRARRPRAFLVGPGTIIAAHAIVILVCWLALLGGVPEDTWIMFMLLVYWAVALAVYAIYCAIAFTIVARRAT